MTQSQGLKNINNSQFYGLGEYRLKTTQNKKIQQELSPSDMPSMTLTRTEMASFAFSIHSDGRNEELTGGVGTVRKRNDCNSYGNGENWRNTNSSAPD